MHDIYLMCFHSFMEFALIAFTDKEIDKFIALCHRLLFSLVTVAIIILLNIIHNMYSVQEMPYINSSCLDPQSLFS